MITALGQSDCSYERICVEIRSRRAELEICSFPVHHPEQVAALRFIQTCCLQTQPKNASLEQGVLRLHFKALECASIRLTANPEESVICLPEDSPCNTGPMRLLTLLPWMSCLRDNGNDTLGETYLWRESCLKVIAIARQSQFTGFYLKCHELERMTHRNYCYTMDQLSSFATEYSVRLPTFPLKPAIYCEFATWATTSEWIFGIDMREKEGITYEEGTEPKTILVSDSVVRGWIESKFHEDVMAACGTLPEFALWPPGLLSLAISYTSFLRHISL